jgi:hypothetical protein
MTHLYSLIFLSLAAVAYTISQLQIQGKLRWMGDAVTFWGSHSYQRKYEWASDELLAFPTKAPTTWYYKLFNLKYKERFPGSATVFVALTDGYHLMQMLFLLLLSASIAFHHDQFWLWLLIYRACFGIVFSIGYKVFAK